MMTKIKEAIKKWIDEWNYCEICEYAYYKQDNKQAAGLTAIFALLPGVSAIVKRIPIVKKITAN